jgi:hypothetical protein
LPRARRPKNPARRPRFEEKDLLDTNLDDAPEHGRESRDWLDRLASKPIGVTTITIIEIRFGRHCPKDGYD